MTKYVLSPEAQNNLIQIKDYSIKKFGSLRTNIYLQNIRAQLEKLADNPARGLIRKDLNVGYHSYFVGSHTIYYRIKPECVEIIDILHQSMEPTNHIID